MLHELLTRYRDEIIGRWAQKLRSRHPDRPEEEVLDTIPAFIDELIKAERKQGGIPESTPLPDSVPHAREHGEQRFRHGFTIADVPMDFGAISDVIGELAIESDFPLDPHSYRLLNECIDKAIAESVEEYFSQSRANEEELIGALNHELRNAIGSAKLAFSVLRGGQLGIESQTARVLARSLDRIERLVCQTLTTVQLRTGYTPRPERIDVRALVNDVLGGATVERDVRIEVDVEEGLTLDADPQLVESALSNLVQNAIKFTRPGGQVVIRARTCSDGTVIEVEDECGGLGGQDPEQLFVPFVQGERKIRGVGLGLAITRQAIEAHGGKVTARDDAPKGCVFSAWLPR